MIFLKYSEFAKNAHSHYAKMPDETNELYARNSIKFEYPESIVQGVSVAEHAAGIEKALDSDFDVVISDTGVRNKSRFVSSYTTDDFPDEILSGKMTDGSEDKISAYINANSSHLICIEVPRDTEARIRMMVINSTHLPFQVLVNCKEGSRLKLFEYYCSAADDRHCIAPLHEFSVGRNAVAEFSMINNKVSGSKLVGFTKTRVSSMASFNSNHVYSGSSVTKMKCHFDAADEGSRIEAKEIVLGAMDQKFDINTFITNSKPHTYAKLESGAVLDGESLCMLKGYAKVEKFAKGATSRVEEHGILLNESAHIDALPDMAIDYSDGVSATHSAATAPIDRDALFYIMSRGVDDADSRKLFIGAFISKYLSGITDPLARELGTSLLLAKADGGKFGELPKVSMKDVWAAKG